MLEVLGPFAPVLKLLHALSGVLLVAGLMGRWVALDRAERAARGGQLASVRALLDASGVFERVVIVSSQVVFVLGLFTAWSMGYPLLGFLQGGGANWLLASLL